MNQTTALERDRTADRSSSHESTPVAIEPLSTWRLVNIRELWVWRELVLVLTWRNIKVRYKQTVLGAAWAILQPTAMMLVFLAVMGRMAGLSTGSTPSPLFFFTGVLLWNFFSTTVNSAANSVVNSHALVTKVYVPRLIIRLSAIGAAGVDFGIASGMLVTLMMFYGTAPSITLLAAPLVVLVTAAAALSVGILFSALNVAYRDFRYTVPFLMQIWMFATPSIYLAADRHLDSPQPTPPTVVAANDSSAVSERSAQAGPTDSRSADDSSSLAATGMALVLNWNPLTGLVRAFRAAVTGGPIEWSSLRFATVTALLGLVCACCYFRRVEGAFADKI